MRSVAIADIGKVDGADVATLRASGGGPTFGVDWSAFTGDTFDGAGPDPDSNYWHTPAANAGNTALDGSGNLNGTRSGQVSTEVDKFVMKGGFNGDFQIEARYLRNSASNPSSNDHYLAIILRDTADAAKLVLKYSKYSNGNDQPVLSSSQYTSNYVQTLNIGGFKITRASGEIRVWVWDNGQSRWEWANDTNGFKAYDNYTSFVTPVFFFTWRAGGGMNMDLQSVANVSGASASTLWSDFY